MLVRRRRCYRGCVVTELVINQRAAYLALRQIGRQGNAVGFRLQLAALAREPNRLPVGDVARQFSHREESF